MDVSPVRGQSLLLDRQKFFQVASLSCSRSPPALLILTGLGILPTVVGSNVWRQLH